MGALLFGLVFLLLVGLCFKFIAARSKSSTAQATQPYPDWFLKFIFGQRTTTKNKLR